MARTMKRCAQGTRQAGLSLIELLVGLAIGLFVVAAATLLLGHHLGDHRRLALEMQLQQDLRAAADLVARDLRRAGHWEHAQLGLAQPGTPPQPNPYTVLTAAAAGTPGSTVMHAYSLDRVSDSSENDVVDSHDQSGFRLRRGAVDSQLGQGNWQQLTDPAALTVTAFELVLLQQPLDLERFCARPRPIGSCPAGSDCPPRQLLREFLLRIDGQSAQDPAVRQRLQARVRLRNDQLRGECPS